MNRRSFLKMFATASAAAGLGIAPLAAATAKPFMYGIRYVEAFDVIQGEMVHRIDIAKDVALEVPKSIQRGMAYQNVSRDQILDVLDRMRKRVPGMPEPEALTYMMDPEVLNSSGKMFSIGWRSEVPNA